MTWGSILIADVGCVLLKYYIRRLAGIGQSRVGIVRWVRVIGRRR